MKKNTEEPADPKKDEEKKDRRKKKEKKEDEPKIEIGLDVDMEGPKAIKRPPKRGGCVSGSAGVGLHGNAQISIHPVLDIKLAGDQGTGFHDYVLIAIRDIPKGRTITDKDVGMIERAKGGKVQAIKQVAGRRASRNIRQGEVFKKGMVR